MCILSASPAVRAELVSIVGEAGLGGGAAVLAQHGRDESGHPAAPPALVAFPADTEQVAAIARLCSKHKACPSSVLCIVLYFTFTGRCP